MSESSNSYLNNRVLKLNVGFLFGDNSPRNHVSELDIPRVCISDDPDKLIVNYIKGTLRLSRTQEGVLLQATLKTAIDDDCYRCLDPIDHTMELNIEELYAFDKSTGTQFYVDEDGNLDMATLLREEILIEQGYFRPCRLTQEGKCHYCSKTLEEATEYSQEDNIDPRMAVLKQLLDSQ